ncbi:hypothetical protein [Pseudomonas sp. ML2-2023-6]|uniref:hypothetical protein n=1 Tax=Pseudomonas sp. ML2-2023-6 TaxID=3122376 RepID=UPI0030D01291
MNKIKFKSDEDYAVFFAPLLFSLSQIANDYGYHDKGDIFTNFLGETIMCVEGYDVRIRSDVSLTFVKEVGIIIRRFKNKDVQLFHGGFVVTHKQIKMLVERELQAS